MRLLLLLLPPPSVPPLHHAAHASHTRMHAANRALWLSVAALVELNTLGAHQPLRIPALSRRAPSDLITALLIRYSV